MCGENLLLLDFFWCDFGTKSFLSSERINKIKDDRTRSQVKLRRSKDTTIQNDMTGHGWQTNMSCPSDEAVTE